MALQPGMLVVDGTVGAGGHAKAFLEKIRPGGFLLGIDRDPQVARLAEERLRAAGFEPGRDFEVVVDRFSRFDEVLASRNISRFDRLFVDIGVCSLHFDDVARGFSFKYEGPLDMRMNPAEAGSRSAAEVVNEAEGPELARIFTQYGEERWSGRIAMAIVRERQDKPFRTTKELRDVVARAIPRGKWPPGIDPATRVFQALRIEVNRELEELDELLAKLPAAMSPGSRAGVISFHSLEDRRVKQAFREMARECVCPPELPICVCGRKKMFRVVTARPVVADPEEVDANPRSRSAKLRVIEKLEG